MIGTRRRRRRRHLRRHLGRHLRRCLSGRSWRRRENRRSDSIQRLDGRATRVNTRRRSVRKLESDAGGGSQRRQDRWWRVRELGRLCVMDRATESWSGHCMSG